MIIIRPMLMPPQGLRVLKPEEFRGLDVLEIGGPTPAFNRIYPQLKSYKVLDCLANSRSGRERPELVVGELLELSKVHRGPFDAVISSDVLEHTANPIKGLGEMKKVLKPGGFTLLILPYYKGNFDHRRTPTPFEHLLDDFNRDVGEDDLTHVREVLEQHDVNRDHVTKAMGYQKFALLCLDNLKYRDMHHHVFDEANVRQMVEFLGMRVKNLIVTHTQIQCVLV